MALDLGEKRIGIAVSDPTRTIATPHSTLSRRSRAGDFAHFAHLIAELQITQLVLGLPITLGGEEGQRAAWVRDYAAQLAAHVTAPIAFFDESLTTMEATAALHSLGHRGKKVKQHVDAVAAALILQAYLDSLREDQLGGE